VKVYGPRAAFAWVRMRGEPSSAFAYHSEATWPEDPEAYQSAVLDGILDEVLATDIGPLPLGVRFTLLEIRWHNVDSSRNAFYCASRAAARRILGRNSFPDNVDR